MRHCAVDQPTNTDSSFPYIYLLVDQLTRSQEHANIQAEERNARHEGRSCSHPKLLHSLSSTQAVTSSIIPMEDHRYSKTVNSIPIFSETLHQNIPERMNIVSLKVDSIGYDSRQKNRFISQHVAGNALKWYLAHCDELFIVE